MFLMEKSACTDPFDVGRLKSVGIEMTLDSVAIPPGLSSRVGIVLFAIKGAVICPLQVRFAHQEAVWSLTIEVPEGVLPEAGIDWKNNILIHLAIKVAGLGDVHFRCSRFGVQLEGKGLVD